MLLHSVYVQVAPASVETNTFEAPLLATPTKMRGVGEPDEPVVESKVTHAIPKEIEFFHVGFA